LLFGLQHLFFISSCYVTRRWLIQKPGYLNYFFLVLQSVEKHGGHLSGDVSLDI
jgi:hypothetical protein